MPRVTSARLTRPSIGETTFVNSRSSSAARSAAATASYLRGRFSGGGGAAFALLERHRVLGRQPVGAALLRAGAVARRRGLRELGAQAGNLRLEGAIVELEQDLSLTHQAAFLERHGRDQSGDARPDADGLHGLEPAGELVPLGDVARDGRGRGHLRKWWRPFLRSALGRTTATASELAITAPPRARAKGRWKA